MEKFDGAKWAAACNRSEKDAWRLNVLVHRPMDLATMQDKATSAKYVCYIISIIISLQLLVLISNQQYKILAGINHLKNFK